MPPFLSKLDASGNFIWAGAIGGSTSEQGVSITLDSFGNIYATGFFLGIVDFDPDAGVYNLNSSTGTDAFVLKMAPCCAGIHELSQNSKNISVYPNPNKGVFNLDVVEEIESAELILFNSLGQIVFEQKIIKGLNRINTKDLAKGLYNCRLISKQQKIEIGKLVIE